PSTPVMALLPTRDQVLAFPPLIQACCHDAVGQQCVGGPDMIGQACRHRWGPRAPLARRTSPSCGGRGWQGGLPTLACWSIRASLDSAGGSIYVPLACG